MTVRIANRQPSSRKLLAAILLAATCQVIPASHAHEDATGVVKERMEAMKGIGKRMKTLKPIVRDADAFDPDRIARLAREIQAISAQVESKFPQGSIEHPSEALPVIWQDWERFTDLITQMHDASVRLGEIAVDGDQKSTWEQFKVLGKTCRSCHTDFREEK